MRRTKDLLGYIVTIVVNIILYYLFNHLHTYHIAFLLPSFSEPLRFISIQIIGTIVANIVYLFFAPIWFKALTRALLNVVSFIFMYKIYLIFPFDFSIYENLPWLTNAVKVAIIVSLAFTAVGVLTEFIRIFIHKSEE